MNIVAQCIYQYNSGLENEKTDIRERKLSNVGLVNMTGLYSNHLMEDIDNILKVLNDI